MRTHRGSHRAPILALAAALWCALVTPVKAEDGSGEAKIEGAALAARLRSLQPAGDSEVTGVLLVKHHRGQPSGQIPISCRITVRGDGWDSTYETTATPSSAAQKLVIKHFTSAPNAYYFAAAPLTNAPLPAMARLVADQIEAPLAGSDFWIDELGLEFLFWPGQTRLKGEMRLGEPCYVLESRAASGRRIKSWFDKDSIEEGTPGLLMAELYNPSGELIKEFDLSGSSFKKVDGRWQLQQMEMRSTKLKSKTILKFDLGDKKN